VKDNKQKNLLGDRPLDLYIYIVKCWQPFPVTTTTSVGHAGFTDSNSYVLD